MEWSKNNLACVKTWSNLMLLKQHDDTFRRAEKLKMKKLLFWNQTASQEMREIMARTICLQLDSIFTEIDEAVYEKKYDSAKAVTAMFAVLKDGDKSLCDLAEAVDSAFNFSEY